MHYHDYETMVFGEDGENPIRPTLLRCLTEASNADTRLKVEIRVKHLGTTSSKAEHTFTVDAKEEHADLILRNVKDRLDAAPGHGFEGQIRLNFYASGNMATKYGSFTRQIRTATPEGSYGGGNGTGSGNENMMGMMNNFMNQGSAPQNDLSGFEGMDEGDREEDELGSFSNNSNDQNEQMQSMMKMMQMIQSGGGSSSKGGAVDQKMAMEWLSHTMSFLFRSLALQMSMFERSTKLVETYAMRFGLPQPLEQQKPERIIREVPMELEFPDYQPSHPTPQPEQERPSILPQLLNAAAAFAGNPGAAQLLQTAATMLNTPPPAPPQPSHPEPRPRPRIKRKKTENVEEESSGGARYIKQDPPKPKTPAKGVSEENWEEDQQPETDFSFGLDGSHEKINPFPKNEMFADFEEGSEEIGEAEEAEDFDFNDFGEDMEIETPEDFPDLNGMTADEMKKTVLDWIQADPDNRKQQVLEMLPELSSVIL